MKNEINAGSMADIAFLLLIFFLVTTTIVEDTGILVKLPPWSEEEPEMVKLNKRNVFKVLVNTNNDLLVRDEQTKIDDLRQRVKDFITNPDNREDLAETPQDAIVSLQNDRGTNFETYLEVYNEIQAAYNELRNERSLAKFKKEFGPKLTKAQRREIRDEIPLIISEAEPTGFGDEE